MEVDSKQLKMGVEIEKEHSKSITGNKSTKSKKIKKIAKDHLAEIPDYYTRLKKMEKKAGVKEAWVDPIEVLHRANRARILKGAKEGKYWLLRSESVEEANKEMRKKFGKGGSGPTGASASLGSGGCGGSIMPKRNVHMREDDRKDLIDKIIETTTSGAIGGFPMPMGGKRGDIAFGGRNKPAKGHPSRVCKIMAGKSVKLPRY